MSDLEVRRRAKLQARRAVVHYVREVDVRPVGIVAEAARRPTRRTIEDTHPIFFIILKCLPYLFFLAAWLLAAHLAWEAVTGG